MCRYDVPSLYWPPPSRSSSSLQPFLGMLVLNVCMLFFFIFWCRACSCVSFCLGPSFRGRVSAVKILLLKKINKIKKTFRSLYRANSGSSLFYDKYVLRMFSTNTQASITFKSLIESRPTSQLNTIFIYWIHNLQLR